MYNTGIMRKETMFRHQSAVTEFNTGIMRKETMFRHQLAAAEFSTATMRREIMSQPQSAAVEFNTDIMPVVITFRQDFTAFNSYIKSSLHKCLY